MRARGFTLIEVVVALAIVAVALMASVRAIGAIAQNNAALKLRLLAQLSAQNRVAELRAMGAFPDVGIRIVSCPQGAVQLQCTEETKVSPNPLFRRIEVRVAEVSTPKIVLAELIGILPRQP